MLQKNETIRTTCTALGADFEGICRHEGQVVFVRGALPGETIVVKIIKVTKQYAVGKLLEIVDGAGARAFMVAANDDLTVASPSAGNACAKATSTSSAMRITPPCPNYPRCGGCTAQHIAYTATLVHKRQQVIDCLTRIGGIHDPQIAEVLPMANPWRYRNKGAFPVGGQLGAPRIGCFAARSHDIIDMATGCLLQTETSDALVAAVRRYMLLQGIAPYNEESHTGLIRHIMTREAADGSAMLMLVINGKRLPGVQTLVEYAQQATDKLRSVIVCENTCRTNVIMGDTVHTLWGEDALTDTLAGFTMRVSPRSFFQVNRMQAERLIDFAVSFCELTGKERVFDVYCGCGAFTLPLSRLSAHVTGIELIEDAVQDARENAKRNGVKNVSFIAGNAELIMRELCAKDGAPDVIVVDPPRKGCTPEAIKAIAEAAPKRLVYVSCNPATLARDVALLGKGGYRFVKGQPVDMFGWTGHVECVVAMER